ncbi:MAG: cytochrome b N-terminal domain-containing protein [Gemmatimonadetes bacterium]|nr:cytochrome b N-terminal domain-containing protein [Gemmatimonadota bacterium]
MTEPEDRLDGSSGPKPSSWLDARLDLAGLRRALLDRAVPDRLTWWHTLGSATLTVFLVQIVTGVALATVYSASPDHAYESVQYLQRHVLSGATLRGIHHWGSSAMVLLVLAHMTRVFAMGAYKYPREPNWILGTAIFVLVMAFGFTGYLLPWDQRAYWATQVGTSMAGTVPWVGSFVASLLKGGAQLGAGTLARFYAFHVLLLPLSLLLLVAVHLILVVRQGIAPLPGALEPDAPARTDDAAYPAFYERASAAAKRGGVRFWPDVIAKDVATAAVVVTILVVLGAWAGAGLEAPADPTDTSYVPRPEWYFLPLYQLLKLVPGSAEGAVIVGVPSIFLLALLALPLFDRGSRRHLLRRPVAMGALVLVLGGAGTLLGAALRDVPPGSEPDESSKALTGPDRAGRALFQRQCASCHVVLGKGGDQGPDLSEVGLRHSSAWLHSFVENPARFRPDSKMAGFGPPVLSHQEIEEVARYLATLRGKPGSSATPDIRDTFPDLIKAGLANSDAPAQGAPPAQKANRSPR